MEYSNHVLKNMYSHCELCPRRCGVDRTVAKGFCGMGNNLVAAKAYLHQWEEPCISYNNGAGTVFFSGCSLHCVFCQNNQISSNNFGAEITVSRLSDIFLDLQDKGADNIELVTPTHFLPDIVRALDTVKHRLLIPVVYNSGGYELIDIINLLDGYIDIYLPDLKYYSSDLSAKYSLAADYFKYASSSILKMIDQVGEIQYNDKGGLIKGTIIRHLVLPNCRHDSMNIMKWIAENTTCDSVLVSIMNQYTPFDYIPEEYPELKRRVTKMEYNSVVKYAAELGLNGFTQEKSSATEKYVPVFDLSGIK